jgi:hypothetical protein
LTPPYVVVNLGSVLRQSTGRGEAGRKPKATKNRVGGGKRRGRRPGGQRKGKKGLIVTELIDEGEVQGNNMAKLELVDNKRPVLMNAETTDMALFVRTSAEEMDSWDRARIEEALIKETLLDDGTAHQIAAEVEEMLSASKIKFVTAPLIRELVNTKLIERGLEKERLSHTRLGVPLYDVDNMIRMPNKENANVPHGPEATNLTLAESIKKEYALINVFSDQRWATPI